MSQITEFVKNFNYVIGRTSLSIFLLGLVFIFTPSLTNDLKAWNGSLLGQSSWPDYGQVSFSLGIFLFILSLIYQLKIYIKIKSLQNEYSISKLENEFFIIDFKGNIFIIDMRKNEIKWLENWQTMSDLKLNGYVIVIFPNIERNNHMYNYTSTEIEKYAKQKFGKMFKGSRYKFGNSIHTRGVVGT